MFVPLILFMGTLALAKNFRYPTPPMGWNSYNYYACEPTEEIIHHNAQGLIDTGLAALGYKIVTTDCGWNAEDRDEQGRLQWNTTLFPSGGKALGEFIHGLGLDFGLYSGAGYKQCGSEVLPASLGYEEQDAQAFEEWGGDSLKYDNCYPINGSTMVDYQSEEAIAPTRFQKMAGVLESLERNMAYFVCQWGVGYDVGEWAGAIGNTYRMSNDIYNGWRSIWRITNEIVPYYRHTKPGAFPDMDMLIVGLHALSPEEERFHFSMWAINKSPLMLGGEIIAINQDARGKQAQLVRRYTEEEWDLWTGELSDNRKVVGIANWRNNTQTVQVDLAAAGVSSAGSVRDVWAAKDLGSLKGGVQKVTLAGHEMKIWVLSDIAEAAEPASAGYYSAAANATATRATVVNCGEGECLPTGQKIGDIAADATVRFDGVSVASAGAKLLGVDFINYETALGTAWDFGSNTRNMTIAVNGEQGKRWAFPISGGDWYETGRLMVEVDGFVAGENKVSFAAVGNAFAPDLVGFEIFE
ncbi:glycoside hydrolase [Apiospora saccharicola]|uniref:Alpha-galactosidase n=1 Tax=Apiospora saccharicola TaxID=335842 RepID=A0ABR1U477_9PEZI